LRTVAPRGHEDDVLGDLEEAHRRHASSHGPVVARLRTALDTLDMAAALMRTRIDLFGIYRGSGTLQDYKLGLRMLVKYPGLTVAGGLALAIAIGLGAAWYEFMGDMFRPTLNVPGGDRLVEVEMRTIGGDPDERRIAHDFMVWRREVKQLEHLGAYRTVERNIIRGDATPEPVIVAETTASMFRAVPVPPLHGRPLLDADEAPGAPAVVVLGYDVWRHRFGGRTDAIGEMLQLGNTPVTIVGVMPQGFAFPINHKMWMPLPLRSSGYAPLEGPGIRVFARVAPGATQAQAYGEILSLHEGIKKASLNTHERLVPRVLAWGGESPGDVPLLEVLVVYAPIVLVLLVACANVGTLIYARTATRDAEISMRYALGASRGRIVTQLFVEALVLASLSAGVGLVFASAALKFGLNAFYSTQPTGMPFWLDPGLDPTTVIFAVALTFVGAGILGVLPALKATGKHTQMQLRNLGAGGSTLRFGAVWTSAMIAQVALTVMCIVPALGISEESWRDRVIRSKFPADQYLAVQIDLDRQTAANGAGDESDASFAARIQQTYGELERRIAREPAVMSVTFADRLPGMGVAIRSAEVETTRDGTLVPISTVWTAAVGPNFFQAFEVAILAGRDFHDGDRVPRPTTVMVNEAFARNFLDGANPVGRRLRFANANPAAPEPWIEIVGMVRDVGMTPTDAGEAPYVFRPASLTSASPVVMGVRTRGRGDHVALAQRVRGIAADIDAGLRLGEVGSLDDLAWRVDRPQMVVAASIATIVALGLFLSAAGIFSLMSVSIARRTKEIGIRAALGASHSRILLGVFRRALLLVGSGVAIGNAVIALSVYFSGVGWGFMLDALTGTSSIMLTVGLLACVQPARRALRIQPTDALREA
jgi:predicted permease